MSDLPYTYFVSFAHGTGFGNVEVHQERPVSNWAEIDGFREIAAVAVRQPASRVVILNYQLLSGPESAS